MDLPDPGIEPESPALQADSLPTELSEKPPSPTYQNPKVYVEVLTGLSHLHSPDGLNITSLSQGCVLRQLLTWVTKTEGTFQGLEQD